MHVLVEKNASVYKSMNLHIWIIPERFDKSNVALVKPNLSFVEIRATVCSHTRTNITTLYIRLNDHITQKGLPFHLIDPDISHLTYPYEQKLR